jgi:hypothetical protein
MMTIKYGTQHWFVSINGDEVESMQDINDEKTFNPLRVVSATTASGFIDVEIGDTFTFERIA